MRWKIRKITLPEDLDTKIIKKFLFLPEHHGDEWRWLEVAVCEMIYHKGYWGGECDQVYFPGKWTFLRWIN